MILLLLLLSQIIAVQRSGGLFVLSWRPNGLTRFQSGKSFSCSCRRRLDHETNTPVFLRYRKELADKSKFEFAPTFTAAYAKDRSINDNELLEGNDKRNVKDNLGPHSVDELSMEDVSDEEMLLACRSHLMRTHKLEWTAREERRRHRRAALLRRGRNGSNILGVESQNYDYQKQKQKENEGVLLEPFLFDYGDDEERRRILLKDLYDYNNEKEIIDATLDDQDDVTTNENTNDPNEHDSEYEDKEEQEYLDGYPTSERFHSSSLYNPTIPRVVTPKTNSTSKLNDDETLQLDETTKRSLAARRTWSSPSFREAWYEKRWGANYTSQARSNALASRVARLEVDDLLEGWEDATKNNLTEEELEQVVKTYVIGNRKRSLTKQKNIQGKASARKNVQTRSVPSIQEFEGPFFLPNSFATSDGKNKTSVEKQRRQAQRQRSERASKAYRTRLANLAKKNTQSPTPSKRVLGSSSNRRNSHARARSACKVPLQQPHPQRVILSAPHRHRGGARPTPPKAALLRVQSTLLNPSQPIKKVDVELILGPQRLSGRREVFVSLLKERYGLAGKCVPSGNGGKKLLYASQCPMKALGQFVLEQVSAEEGKMMKRKKGKKATQRKKIQ